MDQQSVGRGRPRRFDEDQVIHDAMLAFWRHGYDGAGAEVLATATGIGVSSLYNAFGSKHGIFLAALGLYNQLLADRLVPLTRGVEGVRDIEKFLRQLRLSKTATSAIPGCLMANTLGEGGAADSDIARHTAIYQDRILAAFRAALDRAAGRGEIDPGDTGHLAHVFTSSLIGTFIASRNVLPGIDETFTESLMSVLERRQSTT
jgi:TetR/AcrR family transcriptional regulator, transcriptional repressor for nem operon